MAEPSRTPMHGATYGRESGGLTLNEVPMVIAIIGVLIAVQR